VNQLHEVYSTSVALRMALYKSDYFYYYYVENNNNQQHVITHLGHLQCKTV